MRVPPADADMRRRPEFAKPFLAPFFQTDCVRAKTEKTTQIDWLKWKEQGSEFTSRFLRRYERRLAHTYATLKLQQPTNPSNYRASGLIYGLVDSHANLLYVGKTAKTMQERVAKHWSARNTKQDQFKRHLQNLPSPPYSFVLYDIPGAFYADGRSFDRVSEPIEMAFIAMLQPRFNTVRTTSGLNNRRKKPRAAPSFTKASGNEPDTPGASRERGEPWVHVDGEQIRIDQGRGRYFGIRRQLQHLFGLEEDVLQKYDVNPWMKSRVYRVRTWVRRFMAEHLQLPKVGILDELLTARLGEINHLAKKKKSAARTPWFCIQQVSKLLDERKLAAIFRHDAQLRALLADPTEFINTRVSTSLNPPLGVLLSNFTEVSRQTTPEPAPPPEECPCQRYLLQGYHIQGHACGQAHLLDTSSELVTLFDKGRKFRPDGGDEAICTEVDKAVALFIEGYFSDSPPSFARLLREKILSTVGVARIGAEPEVTTTTRRRLRELYKDVVILPVDKSSHDFGFVCRRFYNQDLYTKVNHSVNYAPSEKTPEEVVADHKTYLDDRGLSPTNTLPYLYGTLKLHKEVITMRYIAGVSRKNTVGPEETFPERETRRPDATFSSTTDAQLDLTGLLKSVMEILRREDNDRFNATGFRFFWITESSDDTAFFLKTHVDELSGLVAGTFDFTTMYDQLGLEELSEEISNTIDEAFAAEAERLGIRVEDLVLAKLPELLGTDFCEAPPEADPLTFHMISKERAEGYLATMRGFAKNIVPLVCNAIERDESDRRMPLLLTLRSYASISEKPVLNTVFKQVSKALVEARHTTEPLTEVQMKRNHVMMDIGCVIAEYLDADALSILMDVISPLLIDESSDALLQKKSYKALARICKTRGADIGDQLDRIVQLLAESQKRCSAASKRERIQCMVHVAILHRDSNEVEQLKAFVDGTVSEVMLALKEVNTRTRDAAFMCLSMYAELVQVNTFTNTVLAGFAGTTPAIVSATIVTLSKLLHEFHESMDYKLKETVIKACLMLIKHKSNEIKNAAMSFTRLVLKLVSEREDIKAIMEQNLQLVVDGCLAWTSQKQTPGNTRRNVQLILERCIKRFGYEYMLSLFPEEHRKYLEYIEKERRKEIKKAIKEREARRNPGAAAAGAGARRSKFNELFYGVQKKRKVKSEVLAMPGDETEMDLLDGDVVKRLVGHKAHTALDVRVNNAKEDGMRVSSVNGQIVVQTDADYRRDRRQQLLERKVGEMEGTHRGAFEELGLTKRKRRRDEEQPLDDDVNMFEGGARAAAEEFKKLQDALRGKKERPKDGISKRRRVDTDVRAGAHFKAKGSSGDVKKGAVEPFAYVPLNAKFLNKRHRMKSIARVGAVAETAPRGNKAKQGGSNKRSASSRR
ncbi:Ribosomal RNA-processing protein 12 [Diplonema papillatum]|nr:Ribosomal RNA-processing protein 12 [Diplonema papillatum]